MVWVEDDGISIRDAISIWRWLFDDTSFPVDHWDTATSEAIWHIATWRFAELISPDFLSKKPFWIIRMVFFYYMAWELCRFSLRWKLGLSNTAFQFGLHDPHARAISFWSLRNVPWKINWYAGNINSSAAEISKLIFLEHSRVWETKKEELWSLLFFAKKLRVAFIWSRSSLSLRGWFWSLPKDPGRRCCPVRRGRIPSQTSFWHLGFF